jgi:predicted ATP-grasp superfamily ATP-dependent carboligase
MRQEHFTGPRAVVTGTNRIALSVARSLGRRGIPVLLVRTLDHDVASVSRYVTQRGAWDGKQCNRVDDLLELADGDAPGGSVLVPSDDEEAALMARHHEELGRRFRLTVPPWPILRLGYDKREMHRLATSLGLDQPRTYTPADEREVAELDCPFPAVIKPSVKPKRNALTQAKAWRVDDRSSLLRRYAEACRLVDPQTIMIQELVPGDGTVQLSFAALCENGRVMASLTARRRRQYPVDFGRNSTLVETIEDEVVGRAARDLLAAMRWTGVVEVEFKRDPRTGRTLLLDVNTRGWTWQALGGRAGVDFPYLLWRMTSGRDVPAIVAAPGERWVRVAPDFLAALEEMRRGRLSPREYVASLRGPVEFAVMAPDDPVPVLATPFLQGYRLGRRVVRRRSS